MIEALFKIVDDRRLPASCLHVALALTKHRGALAYGDLVAVTRLSEQTVRRSMEALRNAGYAETSPAPTRHSLAPVEMRLMEEMWDSASDEARERLMAKIVGDLPQEDDAA